MSENSTQPGELPEVATQVDGAGLGESGFATAGLRGQHSPLYQLLMDAWRKIAEKGQAELDKAYEDFCLARETRGEWPVREGDSP